jgi:hypothetical protein
LQTNHCYQNNIEIIINPTLLSKTPVYFVYRVSIYLQHTHFQLFLFNLLFSLQMGDLLNQFLKSIRKRIHKFLLFFQVVIQRLSLQFELLVCVFEESDLGRFQYERLGLEELGFFGVPKT